MAEQKSSSRTFYAWMTVVVAAILVGIWGASTLLITGHAATGTSDQMPWGIFVPGYIFFVAASAGCVIVSLGYALGMKKLELVMKRAVFMGIVTLLAGGLLIILDLGSPLTSIRFFISPNLMSPMWWLSVFYLIYLILLVIEFYLIHKNKIGQIKVVGVFAGLAAIAVHSTLGGLFGLAAVRTYFESAFSPVYFITIAVIIGTALLLFTTILQYKVTKKEMSPELHSVVMGLAKFLGVMVGIAIFFTVWKDLSGLRSTLPTTTLAFEHIISTWWYWVVVLLMGLITPIFLLLNPNTRTSNGILVASVLVLIGMFAARVEFTLGGEIVAIVQDLRHLQSPLGHYSPTFVEIAVEMLAFSVAALLYTFGIKKLALEEVPRHD
ncbi:MAG: NrfD/PsrC family molybdoenzyme membrane anchor subunit [Candidatus Thorarchaeota archaeon]